MIKRPALIIFFYLLSFGRTLVSATATQPHNDPVVSVIIPTYKRPGLLRHALTELSQSKQTHMEVIVIDDSPQQEDPKMLQSLLRSDQKLIYHHDGSKHSSIGMKRNMAADLSSGKYLIQVDDDDLYSNDRIPYQIQPLIDGDAQITVLTHNIWVKLPESDTEDPPRFFQAITNEVLEAPHQGTVAFTRDFWLRSGIRYPDISFAEDRAFLNEAQKVGGVVPLKLPNNNHHVYVRHPGATNVIAGDPEMQFQQFEMVERPDLLDRVNSLMVHLPPSISWKDVRKLRGSKFTSNSELWSEESRTEHRNLNTDLSCGCCVNANYCVNYEQGWDLYGCETFGPCPDIEYFEDLLGPCDSCGFGISCQERYGSFDGCSEQIFSSPSASPSKYRPPCECCVNANTCLEYEEGWNTYDCPILGACPDVEYWENRIGPCDTCPSGVSCSEKYGSFDGCNTFAPTPNPAEGGCVREVISLDFNDLDGGFVLDESIALADGVTVKARKGFEGPFDDAMIFDVQNPSGSDNDLGNFKFLGKILIISADNDSTDPDDAGVGGEVIITFPYSVEMQSMRFIDFDEKASDVGLFDKDGDLIKGFKLPVMSDGGQKVVTMSQGGVWSLKIRFMGSGAVDDISFIPECR